METSDTNIIEIEPEVIFQEVIVKEEPVEFLSETVQVSDLPELKIGTFFDSTNQLPGCKLKPGKRKRNHADHEQPEDINPTHSSRKTSVNQETAIPPQCRFCLCQVPSKSLKKILKKHMTTACNAFQIRPNDAFPFACCNCLNLLDIVVNFKDAVLKADTLLQTNIPYSTGSIWEGPSVRKALNNCKKTVEHLRKQIDIAHTEYLKQQEEGKTLLKEEAPNLHFSELFEEFPKLENNIETDDLTNEDIITSDFEIDYYSADGKEDKKPKKQKKRKKHIDPAREDMVPRDVESDNGKKEKPKKRKKRENRVYPSLELCDLCGQRVCPQAVESHKNRHLGIKPYTCAESGCGMTFYSRLNLALHVRRIHTERAEVVHECKICGKKLKGPAYTFKVHMRLHTSSEKNYVCQVCGKAFKTRRNLRQHDNVHGAFPHKCSFCEKRFNNKWSMKAHEKNIHKKGKHSATAHETFVSTEHVEHAIKAEEMSNNFG